MKPYMLCLFLTLPIATITQDKPTIEPKTPTEQVLFFVAQGKIDKALEYIEQNNISFTKQNTARVHAGIEFTRWLVTMFNRTGRLFSLSAFLGALTLAAVGGHYAYHYLQRYLQNMPISNKEMAFTFLVSTATLLGVPQISNIAYEFWQIGPAMQKNILDEDKIATLLKIIQSRTIEEKNEEHANNTAFEHNSHTEGYV